MMPPIDEIKKICSELSSVDDTKLLLELKMWLDYALTLSYFRFRHQMRLDSDWPSSSGWSYSVRNDETNNLRHGSDLR